MNESISTEQAILQAAEDLFMEKGYKLATTTSIAERAGVTHAMLHYYFRTKEHIFLKVLDKNINEMLLSLHSAMSPESSYWDIIKDIVELHFDFLKKHPRLPFLALEIISSSPEILERYRDKVLGPVTTELSRHKERFSAETNAGRIGDVDFVQMMFSVISYDVMPFFCIPVMKNILKMGDDGIEEFLEQRKKEILRTLYARLFFRDFPETE